MASQSKGYLRVPVWVDDGVVKVLVDDNGRIPIQIEGCDITLDVNLESSDITLGVTESAPLTEIDVTIKASDITVPVAEQSPLSSIQAQGYGWDGAAWRRLPILWGYSDRYAEVEAKADTGATDETLTFSTVGDGVVRVIEGISAINLVGGNTRIEMTANFGGAGVHLKWEPTTLVNELVVFSDPVVLKKDDYFTVKFVACALHDNLRAYAWGYDMKVAE